MGKRNLAALLERMVSIRQICAAHFQSLQKGMMLLPIDIY